MSALRLSLSILLLASNTVIAQAEDTPAIPSPKPISTNGVKSVTLDEVVAEGTPAEAMKFDPIVPALQGQTKSKISTGNIAKELKNDLPFHMNTNLKPGNQVGYQGTGAGAEETDVNVLGIPINGSQGGGADLSSFPQYFFNGYSYQIGPSLGAYDPRGISGSLTLRLWSQDTMGTESERFSFFYSNRKIRQYSFGKSGKKYALIIGVTEGDTVGPGVSLSAIALEAEKLRVTTHLIFSDTKANGFQSERTGAMTASQRTDRVIPVIQVDTKLQDNVTVKASLFHDFNFIHYSDKPTSSKHIARAHQTGIESAIVRGQTRLGIGLRDTEYERTGFRAKIPTEHVANLQLTHTFDLNGIQFEPTVGGNIVTRQGFFPIVTLGFRKEQVSPSDVTGEFFRFGVHHRFPSLLDRYYSASFGPTTVVAPNPDLQPSFIRSIETGADYKNNELKTQLTLYFRDYKHARYTRVTSSGGVDTYKIVNEGDAYTFGAIHTLDFNALPVLDVGTRLNFQRSKVDNLRLPFPYSPEWVGILRLDLHDPNNQYGVEIAQKAATHYEVYSDSANGSSRGDRYYYIDTFFHAQVTDGIRVNLGVENLLDQKTAFRLGFPDEGRVYTMGLVGTL